jgi:polyphosphate kinase
MSKDKIDLNHPSLYTNRELSWLRFNSRVLFQAQIKTNPLLERLKFIAIYYTNLDEFYMIRVAGLKKLYSARLTSPGSDEMLPIDQLEAISKYLHREQMELEKHYFNIVDDLKKEGINITRYRHLDSSAKKIADEYFYEYIFPVINPIAVDATHPFPQLNNLSLSLAIKLTDIENEDIVKFAMVRIPRIMPRFIKIDDNTYLSIESLVRVHIEDIFPGFKVLSTAYFRVTRNADIVIEEEEADDFMEILEQGLKLRHRGAFVRLEIEKDYDEDLLDFLNNYLKINKKDIYEYSVPLNLGALWDIISDKNFSHLLLPIHRPKTLAPLNTNESIFTILDSQDVLTMQPFESFEPVIKFIKDAADDPQVLSIRVTLYRVGKNSPIVKALIDAANAGKQVTAIVELKARFDEENNLVWAKALEDSGAHVIYGIPGFKVHAKIAQVIRRDHDKLKTYVHFSTGNYNEATAKLYTDISYLTSRDEFKADSITFFHNLTSFSKPRDLNNLRMSPSQMKDTLLSLIKNERLKRGEGKIIAKMNSLVDSDIIKALYKASKDGVQCDLIIRGICSLKPGISKISENIRVISIIGKYLEHSRIFYFKHANPQVFISSADWMSRNLKKRYELMIPIYEEYIKEELYDMLNLQLIDNTLSWELKPNGEYEKIVPNSDEKAINSQEFLETSINKRYKSSKQNHIIKRKIFK